MPPSVSSSSSLTSPKAIPPNPRINHFSALSPDLDPKQLPPFSQHSPPKPFVHYSKRSLLKIAKNASIHGWTIPKSMSPLEDWFGPTPNSQVADPAIASIGPSARGGGFGEGFGFGGGIGGRGIGRGGRTLGARRQNESHQAGPSRDTIQSQMDRFIGRPEKKADERRNHNNHNREPKREGEWRRQDPRPPMHVMRQPQEEREPAWMDDNETFGDSSGIAGPSGDGLVHLTQTQDLIAAHRDQRHGGGKPLVSFFGAQPPPEPVKIPKTFNAADYLLPSKSRLESEDPVDEPPRQEANAFQSRFQRFFGPQSTTAVKQEDPVPSHQEPPPRAPEGVDDHMSRLMGLLSTRSPPPNPAPPQRPPLAGPPGFNQPPNFATQQIPPPARQDAAHLLQSEFPQHHAGPATNNSRPDVMQLLAHVQRQPMPPQPPQQLPGPPFDPRNQYPEAMMPRPPPFDPRYEREYLAKPPDMHFGGHPGYGPPPGPPMGMPLPPHMVNHQPTRLNSAQQDMLATLFAGLPRGPG